MVKVVSRLLCLRRLVLLVLVTLVSLIGSQFVLAGSPNLIHRAPARLRGQQLESFPFLGINRVHQELGITGRGISILIIDDFDPNDPHGHGWSVLDIVKAVAPDADIWSCDLTHKDWNVAIPQCLESLKRKPNVYRRTYVMNMSLEAIKNEVGVPYYAPCGGFSDPLNMTIQGFTTYRLVVASAGNDGWSNAVGFPACLPAVLSVGASYDVSGQQWSFFPTQDAPNTANCTETATLDYTLPATPIGPTSWVS